MMGYLREWYLIVILILICLVLFLTGWVFDFTAPFQVVIKKTFLVCWWYFLSYIFRRIRLGKIEWTNEDKKVYYFILLIGSALIFALS